MHNAAVREGAAQCSGGVGLCRVQPKGPLLYPVVAGKSTAPTGVVCAAFDP